MRELMRGTYWDKTYIKLQFFFKSNVWLQSINDYNKGFEQSIQNLEMN